MFNRCKIIFQKWTEIVRMKEYGRRGRIHIKILYNPFKDPDWYPGKGDKVKQELIEASNHYYRSRIE